ncbi:hypothetical protein SAMN06265348_101222 [Pedobacter westerhofensis]|uniref:DUF4397 domain-containing protein n=2 Tax=Pedobacter westerhofensis TaxID=425512 RepID=A0A521AI75_9SPHI|nr:hypothetical protein SAMN06265348_101222 [Pedobacter westerhofensis]
MGATFFSCSKGEANQDPEFGRLSIKDLTAGAVRVVEGENNKFPTSTDGNTFSNILSGKNRFRFYQADDLLLDTSLSVQPYVKNTFVMFKSGNNTDLKIFGSDFKGLDHETLPDPGIVKFSLANFSSTLPNKVNIYINTATYTPNTDKPIQVAQFLNVSTSFSDFQNIKLGITSDNGLVSQFTFIITDPINQTVLASLPVALPKDLDNHLINTVFLFYVDSGGAVTILMSK